MVEYVSNPSVYGQKPKKAHAEIRGGNVYPSLHGHVYFTEAKGGTVVFVEVEGLPDYQPAQGKKNPIGPHGFHLHANGSCALGDPNNPFQAAGGHWNPD